MTGAGTQHFKINITIIAILETMVMEEMQEQPMTALDLVLKINGDSSRGSSTSGSPGQFSHYSGGHPGIDGNYNGNGDSGGGSSSGGSSGGSSNGGGSSSGSSSSSSAGSSSSSSSGVSNGGWGGYGKPIVLDLDGDGVEIALQTGSQTYIDFDDDGILVIDLAEDGTAGADGKISRTREIALALWDEDADTDLESGGSEARLRQQRRRRFRRPVR